jgi:hypothetical protein
MQVVSAVGEIRFEEYGSQQALARLQYTFYGFCYCLCFPSKRYH